MAKAKHGDPTILTSVRFDTPEMGGTPTIFEPGDEDELLEHLDEEYGDGDADAEPPVPSKDEVLERLTKKGHIANFIDLDEDDIEEDDIDLRLSRRAANYEPEPGGVTGEDDTPARDGRTRTARGRSTTNRTASRRKRAAKTESKDEE